MIRASLIAVSLLAAACTPPAEEKAEEPAQEPVAAAPTTREEATAQDTCGAVAYRAMIGTPIAAASFPATPDIRVIMPDTPVTMDFRAERLNVIVDASGNITALECY
ncbi:MAG TPA: I78 family peptidase inhibitor [Candidatus Binatia bacterium]|nr:I78 family peptidase inhibitor [Candidatus Binatia bacterium]